MATSPNSVPASSSADAILASVSNSVPASTQVSAPLPTYSTPTQSVSSPASQTSLPLPSSLSSQASSSPSSSSATSTISTSQSGVATSTSDSSDPSIVPPPQWKFSSGDTIITPNVTTVILHGVATNKPAMQYVEQNEPPSPSLGASLLVAGVDGSLSTGYSISPETGCLPVTNQTSLLSLTDAPHISRDGGRGGYLNGHHLFVFCDTGSYTPASETNEGNFLGFVSSSVAIDVGEKGLLDLPLDIEDGVGQWSDNSGRMRGFAPLTTGEQSYNLVMQGGGQRYALWPESSMIPLNVTHSLIYTPIIYDNVNEVTGATTFTYTGATPIFITAGNSGGPIGERPVGKLFEEYEVEWGVVGGIRGWGEGGVGGNDGSVYLFGAVENGLLMARVDPTQTTNRDAVCIRSTSALLNLLILI
jgi:hypothetical protein